MRVGGKGSRFVAALALALAAGRVAAQEPAPAPHPAAGATPAHEVHAEEHEHANELAVFVGGTAEGDHTHFTIGGEYERRLGERWGLSFLGEHVSDIDAWLFLAPLTFRPVRGLGLKLYAGPGVESKAPEAEEHLPAKEGSHSTGEPGQGGRGAVFVFRTGAGWAFELERLALTPQVEIDLAREHGRWETAVVFGVAVGFGF